MIDLISELLAPIDTSLRKFEEHYNEERRSAAHRIEQLTRALEESESMLNNSISKAPRPLLQLGEYLAGLLDEDQWPVAERYLNAAAIACKEDNE